VNIPDYGTEEVADSAMSHILNLYRGTFRLAQEVALGSRIKGPDAIAHACGGSVTRVRGSTLGLVGLGRIGGAVAVRAKAFGFDVVFYDPYVPDGVDKMLGIMRVDSLEAVMSQCRCISLHCNATKDNERFINSEMLALCAPGTAVMNPTFCRVSYGGARYHQISPGGTMPPMKCRHVPREHGAWRARRRGGVGRRTRVRSDRLCGIGRALERTVCAWHGPARQRSQPDLHATQRVVLDRIAAGNAHERGGGCQAGARWRQAQECREPRLPPGVSSECHSGKARLETAK
jgi:hypothetical protein